MDIPFFRPAIAADEIEAVTAVLRSGWLTTYFDMLEEMSDTEAKHQVLAR